MIYKQRKSIRLKDFDYSSNGAYFVTICTHNWHPFFGSIHNEKIILNEMGIIAEKNWLQLTNHFIDIQLDEFKVMPNHIHGIMFIQKERKETLNVLRPEDTSEWMLMRNPKPVLGKIIRHYKAKTTFYTHQLSFSSFKWQRNYYEHIIRNEKDLQNARHYIHYNHLKWGGDNEFGKENEK